MQSTPSSTPVIPRVIFVEELSTLIGKTENTIRTCATNKKYQHLIPTPFKLPNSRRLCWYEHDVFAWINTHHHIEPAVKRRPGRPTKAEQIAAQRKSLPTQLLSRG